MPPITDELIEKYFKGLCTGEEAVAVQEFLKEHTDHDWLAKEWEESDGISALPGNYTQQIYNEVEAAVKKTMQQKFSVWKYAAIAACIAGAIVSLVLVNKKPSASPLASVVKTLPGPIWSIQHNSTEKEMKLVLPDGSILTLSPNAFVRYRAAFNSYDKREIFMTGRVFFEVAKNKQKPFTVYSRNLNTTALGTAFYVDAPVNANKLSVQLLEGKVVVAVNPDKHETSNFYLVPGDELVFNTVSSRARIDGLTARMRTRRTGKNKKEAAGGAEANSSFMFNNQTLPEVLDQLAVMYGVEIKYSKASIGNIYFIGKIDQEDSLNKILQDIALLNKLTVRKQNGGYILTKNQ